MKKRIHQIDLFRKYPHEMQFELLEKMFQNAAYTEFGKKYNFKNFKNYEDFRLNVPLQEYDDLKPWIDRCFNGEQDLIWPTEIKWFAKSSGTTSNRSKIIPVTRESLEDCHFRGGMDLLALYYENHPTARLYRGKYLVIGGSSEDLPSRDSGYVGDLSAIIMKNLPWWAEIRRTPSIEIATMTDWQKKVDAIAYASMEEDVHLMTGVPSWTMVILQRILEISGKNNIMEIWPNLELYMHGGVSFEPYRAQFERLIENPDMNYVESYNASEGFFGIQDSVDGNDLLLMLDYGIFYEFIPMNCYEGTNSKTILSLSEVEIGVKYALVITTNGGLWRYIIGDTVQFTSLIPARIRIVGRTKSFINSCGEEVIVDNADKAISIACQKHDSAIKDYTAGPIYMKQAKAGGHEWLIEFSKAPLNMSGFIETLDIALRELNSDYDAKRSHERALALPIVKSLNPGTFDIWLKEKGKLGGQHKIPRLNNNREFLEQILSLSDRT